MQAMREGTALLSNYRSFVQDGGFHTYVFGDVFGEPGFDPFYMPDASGYALFDWIAELVNPDPGASPPNSVSADLPISVEYSFHFAS